MFKRIFFIIILLANILISNSQANIFEDMIKEIEDAKKFLCSAGETRSETWPGYEPINRENFDKEHLCPPWNKEGGRNATSCLLKKPLAKLNSSS